MAIVIAVIAVAFIIWGLLCLFARDLVWSLWKFSYRMEGVATERTDLWDLRITIGGIASIVFGLFFLMVSLTPNSSLSFWSIPDIPTIQRPTPLPPSPTASPLPTPATFPPMVLAEHVEGGILFHFVAEEEDIVVPAEGAEVFTRFQVLGDRVYYEGRYATREGVVTLPTPDFPGGLTTLVAPDGSRIAWLFLDNRISLSDRSGEAHFRLVLTDGSGRDPRLMWERVATFYDNRGAALLAWRQDGKMLYLSQPRLGVAWCCFNYNPAVMGLDLTTGETTILGDEDAFDAAVSPDGNRLAQSFDDGEVRLRSLTDGTERTVADGKAGSVAGDFSFSPEGRWLAWLEMTAGETYRLWAVRLPDEKATMVWDLGQLIGEPRIAGWLGPDTLVVVLHESAGSGGSSYRLRLPDGEPERFSAYDFLGLLSKESAVLLPTPAPTPFPDASDIVAAILAEEARTAGRTPEPVLPGEKRAAFVTPGSFTTPGADERVALVAGIGAEDEVRWVIIGQVEGQWQIVGTSSPLGWGFDSVPSTYFPPDRTDFDHDGQHELLVHTGRMQSGVMTSADALYRWNGWGLVRVWGTETLLDDRMADPSVVHEPYRTLRRVEWQWEDVDGDGVDEIRTHESVAYYEPNEDGYVPDDALPFREEERETVFHWNGTAFTP